MCDFSTGFKEPEMTKNRPVIVLTPSMKGRANLVTVVPLSTASPKSPYNHHCVIEKKYLPNLGFFQGKECWVKGDMVYPVGFQRLDMIKLGTRAANGKREYFDRRLGRDKMRQIYSCVLHGLSLGDLVRHLPE